MKKKRNTRITFKPYNQDQLILLPPSLKDFITPNHPVQYVSDIVDKIDLEPLMKKYKGGGTSTYHPKMMLKVLVYAYLKNIYSSRSIESALKENVYFMWLSGMNQPDHNTINRFRSDKLKGVLKEVFGQVVELLVDAGLITLKEIYIDGTKIEANANKYSFVWGNSIKSSKERIKKQLQELWEYTQQVAQEELEDTSTLDFEEIDAEKVKQTIEKIDQALKEKDVKKKVKQKLTYAKKNWPDKLQEYDQKQEILSGRNSYSKTDPDATFMRMKEDHMQNGQLKPAYNWQMGTNNQFILNYSLHQVTTDTSTLESHLDGYNELYQKYPEQCTTDAGYGSEQNYEYLDQKDIEAFVKYNYFHKEQKKKWKLDPSKSSNLYYNQEQDCLYCPMGQKMRCIGQKTKKTKNGYTQTYHRYQAQNCAGCNIHGACFKGKGNRIVEISKKLNNYKQTARDKLLSDQGIQKRKQRPADVEAVFGQIKSNKKFKRFLLRGLEKVEIEIGLVSIAHNIAKMAG